MSISPKRDKDPDGVLVPKFSDPGAAVGGAAGSRLSAFGVRSTAILLDKELAFDIESKLELLSRGVGRLTGSVISGGGNIMKYRNLGNHDLRISEISFGCGPSAGLMVGSDRAEQSRTVALALDQGINLFDTAAAYGDGKSEEQLGRTLKELNARPQIASKVLITGRDLHQISKSIKLSVENSLRRLRIDCVDIIQLHNRVARDRNAQKIVGLGPILSIDDFLGEGGVAETFERLRDEGKVRFFGFTAFGGEIEGIRSLIESGRFHAINAVFNLLNPTALWPPPTHFDAPDYGRVIALASAKGMGVLVIRAFAGGMLTPQSVLNPPLKEHLNDRHFEDPGLLPRILPVFEEQKVYGNIVPFAVQYVLSFQAITSAVLGFSRESHIVDALSNNREFPFDSGRRLAEIYSAK